MQKKTTLLCILDGFGYTPSKKHNAVFSANTPNLDRINSVYNHSLLETSGESVGLPKGQMGNSEVGHITIGSGRIIFQTLPKVNQEIESDKLKQSPLLQEFIKKTQKSTGVAHLCAMLSDGGVHSHQEHLIYLAKTLENLGITTKLHIFLDGRDASQKSAKIYIQKLLNNNLQIATAIGRFYAMDRDLKWDRTEIACKAIIDAIGDTTDDFLAAIEKNYQNEITDEFIKPLISSDYSPMQDGDSFLMINFRADRVRQILEALLINDFSHFFTRKIHFSSQLGMVEYKDNIDKVLPCLFPKKFLKNTLADVLEQNNMTQLHISETEKYAHITFFFNGGIEQSKKGEDRILIKSPNVKTYDLKPEMSAIELTEKLNNAIKSQQYDFIVVNYANLDMVGHTGNWQASVKAVEVIDEMLAKLEKSILATNGNMVITADHGNIEVMFDKEKNQPCTSHSLNKVPFILINKNKNKVQDGDLSDIAPSILSLMNVAIPSEMSGKNLIEE